MKQLLTFLAALLAAAVLDAQDYKLSWRFVALHVPCPRFYGPAQLTEAYPTPVSAFGLKVTQV